MNNETQSLRGLDNLIRLFGKLQSADTPDYNLSLLQVELQRWNESYKNSQNNRCTTKTLLEILQKLDLANSATRSTVSRIRRNLNNLEQPMLARIHAEKAAESAQPIDEIIAIKLTQLLEKTNIQNGKVAIIGSNKISTFSNILANFSGSIITNELVESSYDVLQENITDCPNIPDQSFDIILSVHSFEKVDRPWQASKEIIRILKNGGFTFHITMFSNYYNPNPVDYWRYSPMCMKSLFGELEELVAEYYADKRRLDDSLDDSKENKVIEESFKDGFGGWRETWYTLYAGRKL